jgi:sulfate transport system substrate-binding protein
MRGTINRQPRWSIRVDSFLFLIAFTLTGCTSSQDANIDRLRIGAYSVVREVVHDGLIPKFKALWKERTGRQVVFEEAYNGSGAQARSIASGFDVDIAILSHEGDMEVLVQAGKVAPDWNTGPSRGIISRSLVVIGHRPGNPKHLKDWSDLAKPGVGVLYPDPKTSGGARWNINAIYGAAILSTGGSQDAARDRLASIQRNVVNMDASGRQSMANFIERQTGDAVVSYENELRLRNKAGQPVPYVIPPLTLSIESPAAIVKPSVEAHGNRKLAEAFLEFLLSEEGQQVFTEYGFRPLDSNGSVGEGPQPSQVFTMADIGGWTKVEKTLYGPDGVWVSIFAAQARTDQE